MYKKHLKYSLSPLLAALLLSGCGSNTTTSASTMPDFTTPTSKTLIEGQTAVMTISATNAASYKISGGADSDKFSINTSSGVLTFKVAPDFENPTDTDESQTYIVTITATSSADESKTHTITVTITNNTSDDADETPPVFNDNNYSKNIQENNQLNLTIAATDDSTPITYAIDSGADKNRFDINNTTGVVTFAYFTPDFEDKSDADSNNEYDIVVSATDTQTNKTTQSIKITITDDATDAGAASKRVLKTGVDDGVIEGLPFGDDRTVGGLTWEDDDDIQVNRNFADAVAHCTDGDWRLPTRRELFKIVNYSKSGNAENPMIDDTFTQKNNGYFWTSQELTLWGGGGEENNQSFAISFANGIDFAVLKTEADGYHARCVKGDAIPDGNFALSTDNSVITDSSTNLQWSNDTAGVNQPLSWADAKLRCKNLVFGSKNDWRLPNINELHSIKPKHNNNFTFVDSVEIHNVTGPYWSSTEDNDPTKAKYIENVSHFDYHIVDGNRTLGARDTLKDAAISKDDNGSVRSRCVRGGHL